MQEKAHGKRPQGRGRRWPAPALGLPSYDVVRGRCGSGGPAILRRLRSADPSSTKEWRALLAMAALVTLATKAASEPSPKAHTISRCPLCLETVTANSTCVGSFCISRTSNRCADWALNRTLFFRQIGKNCDQQVRLWKASQQVSPSCLHHSDPVDASRLASLSLRPLPTAIQTRKSLKRSVLWELRVAPVGCHDPRRDVRGNGPAT